MIIMKYRLCIIGLLLMCCATLCAQTIRNSNNSVVARIENDGTVRNSNNSVVARISSSGDIRDSNNRFLGKIIDYLSFHTSFRTELKSLPVLSVLFA